MATLTGRNILLGVSGGIAAYKAADLVRRLRDAGAAVRVVLTDNAARFVTALTFQALSGEPVRQSAWDEAAEAAMGHIELARWADLVLVAPASADRLAKLAGGIADDLLGTCVLAAADKPLLLAPAMNQAMWRHPAVVANVATLAARGVAFVGPDSGDQACGDVGAGRMSEPLAIVDAVADRLATRDDFRGFKLVISAGPTYEDIDPVRFIGNRSSGRMGFAIADAAARRGAEVVLVAGPVKVPTPAGVTRIDVRNAAQMRAAVLAAMPGCTVYVGAAAVADYTPAAPYDRKFKKTSAGELTLALTRTPDILSEVAARPDRPFVLGFAAETHDVLAYARDKLERKKLDLIAANQVGSPGCAFDADDNEITLLWPDGQRILARDSKAVLAHRLLDAVLERRAAIAGPAR